MTPQTKNIDDKDREQVGHTSALNCGEASEKSKPLEENRQHASLSQSAREEKEEKSKKRGGKWRSTKTIPPVCGRTVSLLASNGFFVCGNKGNAPATATGVYTWRESMRFTVDYAGGGMIALRSCGKYLAVTNDRRKVSCDDQKPFREWNKFEWVEHESGEVSLRSANGHYLSCEYGRMFMTCDRDDAGPLERFSVVWKNY